MQAARDEFLAGAGFPGDENGGVDRRDLDDPLQDLDHGVGLSDDAGGPAKPRPFDRSRPHEHDLLGVRRTPERGGHASGFRPL